MPKQAGVGRGEESLERFSFRLGMIPLNLPRCQGSRPRKGSEVYEGASLSLTGEHHELAGGGTNPGNETVCRSVNSPLRPGPFVAVDSLRLLLLPWL